MLEIFCVMMCVNSLLICLLFMYAEMWMFVWDDQERFSMETLCALILPIFAGIGHTISCFVFGTKITTELVRWWGHVITIGVCIAAIGITFYCSIVKYLLEGYRPNLVVFGVSVAYIAALYLPCLFFVA